MISCIQIHARELHSSVNPFLLCHRLFPVVRFVDTTCADKFNTGPGSDLPKCQQRISCNVEDTYDIMGMRDTCLCNAASLDKPTICECKASIQRDDSVRCRCQPK